VVPARAQRRARRRKFLWAAVVAVAIAGLLLLVWPPDAHFDASASVRIGARGPDEGKPLTLSYEAGRVSRPSSISRISKAATSSRPVVVQLHARSENRRTAETRVRDGVEEVRALATSVVAAASGDARGQLDGEVAGLAAVVAGQQARLTDAESAITRWHADTGVADPAEQLMVLDVALGSAVEDGASAQTLTELQQRRLEMAAHLGAYTQLTAARDAARAALESADRAHAEALAKLGAVLARAESQVVRTPTVARRVDGTRSPLQLGIAAVLLVAAIVAADVLFLTRVRFALPHAEESARARRRRRKEERRQRAEVRRRTGARRPARRRVEAKPLEFPNIEVRVVNRDGGRGVELRDVPAGPEQPAPEPSP
jgi:hypothetical protein